MCAKYVHIVTQAQPSSSRGLQRRRTGRDPGVSAKDDGHSWHHPHGCSHISDNFVSPTSYSTGDTGNVGTFCCLGKIHPGVLFFFVLWDTVFLCLDFSDNSSFSDWHWTPVSLNS